MDGSGARCRGKTVAIVGGGFSGAVIALQLARAGVGRVLVFEPRAVLGQGLAYSTADAAHRINAPACRMSVYPDDPDHFSRWLASRGEDDPQAALPPDGRLFPRRAVFGSYVADQVAPWLRAGRVVHVRAAVESLRQGKPGWVVGAGAESFYADIAVLATGQAPARIPAVFRTVAGHPGLVADPWRPGALRDVGGRVLVVGTGLTMADIVATLRQGGGVGRILALSRRGQVPREHAAAADGEAVAACATAVGLVRAVRAAVAQAQAAGRPWQSVFDALRCQAPALWAALPVAERRRLLRHVRPFWDSHRYRLAPATAAILREGRRDGWLTMAAGSVLEAAPGEAPGTICVRWRPRGGTAGVCALFDAVVLSIGPGDMCEVPLVAALIRDGVVTPDPTGLGLQCGGGGLVGGGEAPLFLAGPLTRGVFGEMTGVPEIARQAVDVAAAIGAVVFVGA